MDNKVLDCGFEINLKASNGSVIRNVIVFNALCTTPLCSSAAAALATVRSFSATKLDETCSSLIKFSGNWGIDRNSLKESTSPKSTLDPGSSPTPKRKKWTILRADARASLLIPFFSDGVKINIWRTFEKPPDARKAERNRTEWSKTLSVRNSGAGRRMLSIIWSAYVMRADGTELIFSNAFHPSLPLEFMAV